MNAARAFCGGGHRRRGSSVLPTSISLWRGRHRDVSHPRAELALPKPPIHLGSPASPLAEANIIESFWLEETLNIIESNH